MARQRNYSNIYFNSRVQLYRLRGYDSSQSRAMAREDAIRQGQDVNFGRFGNRRIILDTNQTRTAQYNRNRNSGMSREASMNDVRRSEASGYNNPFPRRSVTPDGVSRINTSSYQTTQGRPTQGGGGGSAQRSGAGSGG